MRRQLPLRRLSLRPQVELLESRNLLSFGPSTNFAVDGNPLGMALADFNGDGKLDAVTANYGGATVSVLLGNGDGTFQPAQNFAAGANASNVQIGDFNGDKIPDLAVGHFSGSAVTVSVLLGVGDGTFEYPGDYLVGNQPIWVAVADLNGDNILDIAAANNNSASISVLLGIGDGTFQDAQSYAVGRSPIGISVADLNGDTIPDLLVGNSGPDTLGILFGNGDGTFQPPVDYPIGNNTAYAAVGDFNGDGAPDLAVVCNSNSNNVIILLNDGQGAFYTIALYQVDPGPIGAALADFNGDGKLDILIGYYNLSASNTNVTTLLGNGDGTFQDPVDYAADVGPTGVAVGDLNGDGAPDLVAANVLTSDISVFLNLNDWGGPGGRALPPDQSGPQRGGQEPVVMPANSGTDLGRQAEAFFLFPRAKEDARKDGELAMSSGIGARGGDDFGLDGNLHVGPFSNHVLPDGGMPGMVLDEFISTGSGD
jgi:hypothetical protein